MSRRAWAAAPAATEGRSARAWAAAFAGLALWGLLLRMAAIASGGSLHGDEALYASLGRHALERGDLLFNGRALNKPPLVPWVLAALQGLLGSQDYVARFSGALAYLAGVAGLARWLAPAWGWRAAAVALGLWSLSPLSWLQGSTAMCDPWLAAGALLSLSALAAGRPRAAGFCAGLAFASKQTGLLFAGLGLLCLASEQGWRGGGVRTYLRAFGWVAAGVLLHSLLFAHPRLGAFLESGEGSEHPLNFFQPGGSPLGERLAFWASQFRWLGPSAPALAALAALGAAGVFGKGPWRRASLALALGLLGYAGLLILGGLPRYERYALLAVPPLALLLARGAAWVEGLPALLLLAALAAANLGAAGPGAWPALGPFEARSAGWRELGAWARPRLAREGAAVLGGAAVEESWCADFYLHGRDGTPVLARRGDLSWRSEPGPGLLVLLRGEDPALEAARAPDFAAPAAGRRQLLAWELPLPAEAQR